MPFLQFVFVTVFDFCLLVERLKEKQTQLSCKLLKTATHKQGRKAPPLSNPTCFGNQIRKRNQHDIFALKQSVQDHMS